MRPKTNIITPINNASFRLPFLPPIFVPIFIIGLVIIVFFAAIFSNIYQEVAADPAFIAQGNELTFITTILSHLPIIISVMGVMLMVVLYKTSNYAE